MYTELLAFSSEFNLAEGMLGSGDVGTNKRQWMAMYILLNFEDCLDFQQEDARSRPRGLWLLISSSVSQSVVSRRVLLYGAECPIHSRQLSTQFRRHWPLQTNSKLFEPEESPVHRSCRLMLDPVDCTS